MKPRKDKEVGPFLAESAAGARMRYSIQCGSCGAAEALGLQNFSYAVARGVLPKKFAALGWRVGSRAAKHVCPACQEKSTDVMVAAPDIVAPPTRIATDSKEIPVTSPPETIRPLKAEEPRPASIDERRIINEKLADVYGDKGYTGDWTDEKLARDLGVPRAWVAQVREFSYGPNLNENDVKALAMAQGYVNKANAEYETMLSASSDALAKINRIRDEAIGAMEAALTKAAALIADARRLVEGR